MPINTVSLFIVSKVYHPELGQKKGRLRIMAKNKVEVSGVKVNQGPGSLSWMLSFFGTVVVIFLLVAGDDRLERDHTGQLFDEIKESLGSDGDLEKLKADKKYSKFFENLTREDRIGLAQIESTINEVEKNGNKNSPWMKINNNILSTRFPKVNNLAKLRASATELKEVIESGKTLQKRKTKISLSGKNLSRVYEEVLDDVSEMFLSGRNIVPDTSFDPMEDEIDLFQKGGLKATPRIQGIPEGLEGEEMLSRFLRPSFVGRFTEVAEYARARTSRLIKDVESLRNDRKTLEEELATRERKIEEYKKTINSELQEGLLTFIKPHFSERSEWINDTSKKVNKAVSSLAGKGV